MLPHVDGLDICRILRAEASDIPILLLTARSTEEDMLLGLDLGADDYLTKPYSPRELTARVRAMLRRSGRSGAAGGDLLRVGEVELDTARFEVRVAGRQVALTSKEFAILETLAREPGRVFTRAQIIERVFGFDVVLERTVDAHMRNLRLKVEAEPIRPRYLETVYGRGYRLTDGEIRHETDSGGRSRRTSRKADGDGRPREARP
jgi:DNA-binding response OmpR family regulator